jgi:hypothetical protein
MMNSDMTYCIKFDCNLPQYLKLHTDVLSNRYGLPAQFYKGVGHVGSFNDGFSGRGKEVSYEQAKTIFAHIKEHGFNEE